MTSPAPSPSETDPRTDPELAELERVRARFLGFHREFQADTSETETGS